MNDVAGQFAATYFFSDVNAAEIATSNAEVLAVDPTVTSVQVTDHVVRPGDTFASLGGSPHIGPAADLIRSNIATRSVYTSGTPLLIDMTSASPDATDLTTFLDEHQITAAQFGFFNAPSALVPGAQLDVPDLATMPTDAYGAYYAPEGLRLADVAEALGVSAADVAELNADVPGLFDPSQNITACGVTKSPIGPDATFASLFEYSRANGGSATLQLFAAAIAESPGLFLPGALHPHPASDEPVGDDAHRHRRRSKRRHCGARPRQCGDLRIPQPRPGRVAARWRRHQVPDDRQLRNLQHARRPIPATSTP